MPKPSGAQPAPNSQLLEQRAMGRLVLGRYRLVRELARGGMGVVYLGRVEGAAGFAKPVVIKTVIPQLDRDSRLTQLFAREARILANVQHRNVVGVLDFGQDAGSYVMVLEYVHGYDLGQWFRYVQQARGEFSVSHAVHVICSVLDALAYAHSLARSDGTPLGIVHRDISPANILIDVQGQVKLHDFGIARMADDDYKTQDGSFRGTLPFTAPEILKGAVPTPLIDVYACGVVLYQLIVGANPFKGKESAETVHRVLTHVPELLRTRRLDVPEGLDRAIRRAITKRPELRFSSAAAFATALREASSVNEQTRSEFAAQLLRDFTGEMPAQLGLESLAVRDAAWREEQDAPPERRVSLSSSPPATAQPAEATATIVESKPLGAPEFVTMTSRSADTHLAEGANTREQSALEPAPIAPGARLPQPTRVPWAWLGLGALTTIAAAAVVAFFVTQPGAPRAPAKFLVIEKEALDPSLGAATGSSSALANAAVASPTETSAISPSAVGPNRLPADGTSNAAPPAQNSGAKPKSKANLLSAAFQRQQERISGCFGQHRAEIAGEPEVAVRFRIDGGGRVESAQLLPAALGNTALGVCVLGVARSTQFPGSGEPVTFSIPIKARRLSQ